MHVVLGVAYGYPDFVYERFVKSLRRSIPECKCVLWVSPDITAVTRQLFASYSIEYHIVAEAFYHIQSWRFKLYKNWLEEHPETKDFMCFLTDVRDVLFQGNLFQFPFTKADIYIFLEQRSIATCPTNSGWIEDAFSLEILNQIKDNRIICSGTTLGYYTAIIRYLELMCAVADVVYSKKLKRVDGVDQGIHNVLFYTNQLNPYHYCALDNDNGPVATLNDAKHLINPDSLIVNALGHPNEVIHQVDRLPAEMISCVCTLQDVPSIDLIAASNIYHGRDILDFSGTNETIEKYSGKG